MFAKLVLDSSEYDEGLDDSKKKASSFGDKVKTAFKVGGAAIAAVTTATAALGASFVKGAGDIAAYGDNIDKMSQKMGLSATAYQEWDAVMQHSGTSIEALQSSMKTLANAVESGNKAFERLGISEDQIAGMNNEELFSATITALQNVENETERTYLAGQLLGRGATELGALLNTSAEETQAMKDRVHELGGVMSDEAIKASAAYQDSLQDMQTSFSGLKRNLLADFMPGIKTVMDGLTAIFSGDSENGIAIVSRGVDEVLASITDRLPQFLDFGTKVLMAIVQAIIDNLPKMLESGGRLVGELIAGLIQNIPLLIKMAPDLVVAIVKGLVSAWPSIKQAGVDLVKVAGDGLKSVMSSASQWGKDLMDNFIGGINAKIQALKNAVSGVANTVKSFLGFSEPKEGPLSNFHTYAPDMMKLFAEGIRDNEKLITDQISKSFDFGEKTVQAFGGISTPISLVVQPTLDGRVIGEFAYKYTINKNRSVGR